MTAISDVKVATIVGTATNPRHPYDGTHGGLTDGNDLDGTPSGGCSSRVRYPHFDCKFCNVVAEAGPKIKWFDLAA